MKIELGGGDLKAAAQNWNTLVKGKNKSKNYCIPASLEEYKKFDTYAPRLKINCKDWILLENATVAFNEVVSRIYNHSELRGVASFRTVHMAVKRELEVELSAREKNSKSKRAFTEILENIQCSINVEINHFDFFFVVEGLRLESLERISCGKAEIFVFGQELRDQLITGHFGAVDSQNSEASVRTQDFIDENFMNRLCIKCTAYGDSNIAHKKAHRQVRELINYFRYILCLLIHDRVSEQVIKINLLSETYSNSEKTLIRRYKNNDVILFSGRGRKPLQALSINKSFLEDLSCNGFLNDFIAMIDAPLQTQLEGCISTAIYWIGEAQDEVDLDVSFLKYWTALECMFTGSEPPTHALAKGVSTINAFSNYEFISIEDAEEVYRSMTKLYNKRSDIIHRGMNYLNNQIINEADISKICKYTAWSILSLFDLRAVGYVDMHEVGDQINRLYVKWRSSSMAARDLFHEAVKVALQKENWLITDDPLRLEVGGAKFEIDLGAERLLAAERAGKKIAVEIKTFLGDSPVTDYHLALGQFLNYRLALEFIEPGRILYLAIPIAVHEAFFQREFAQISVERYQISRIVYDPVREVIVQWIS